MLAFNPRSIRLIPELRFNHLPNLGMAGNYGSSLKLVVVDVIELRQLWPSQPRAMAEVL